MIEDIEREKIGWGMLRISFALVFIMLLILPFGMSVTYASMGDVYGDLVSSWNSYNGSQSFIGNVGLGISTPIQKLDINGGNLWLRNDNSIAMWGTSDTDLQISSDGTNPVYNSTGVHTFYNTTGLGTIRYGSALTSTQINSQTDVLETFKLGSELYNLDGSINHSAFGNCYKQVKDADLDRPKIEYYEEEVCEILIEEIDLEPICHNEIRERITYPYTKLTDVVDLTCQGAEQYQALALLNKNVDLYEDLTAFNNSILAEHYVTNTTKDPATLTKIENFYDNLNTKTYAEMKDLILTPEGKLSDNVLFDYELSPYGSYNLEAIGHTNRAINVLMLWKIANIEDKQNKQLDCWDLTTQAEIVSCMREI